MKMISKRNIFLSINGLIGIILITILSLLFGSSNQPGTKEMLIAAKNMEQALKEIQSYCISHQINTNTAEDPRNTGLIGPEWSEITTTQGDPEAKRTTINPNIAALMVHLLVEAGVKKGDTVAIGSSASFPALLIASLSAAKAMELHPLVIFSFGSSSFGASNPDFNVWDIYQLLLNQNIFTVFPVAASLGGEDDTGSEFDKSLKDSILMSLHKAGIPLINEKSLPDNRLQRTRFYFNGTPERIKAFINSGGGYANIGSSPLVLNIKPGLVKKSRIPEPGKQGMIHEMLLQNIPVIHLLYIKGLAQKYNLPWDPVSQPEIIKQSFHLYSSSRYVGLALSIIGLLWFIIVMVRYGAQFNRREPHRFLHKTHGNNAS
jgi:poly-gamma-glutamate system protein